MADGETPSGRIATRQRARVAPAHDYALDSHAVRSGRKLRVIRFMVHELGMDQFVQEFDVALGVDLLESTASCELVVVGRPCRARSTSIVRQGKQVLMASRRGGADQVQLRDVRSDDVDVYVRMRCDPEMMAELGGPLPREGIEAKVRQDVEDTAAGRTWVLMILPDEDDPDRVAGSVVLWSHEHDGNTISEIGWMVLPEFQDRGLGKAAVRVLLQRARDASRWGVVHAFPGVTNGPSNGICRSLGFTLVGQEDVEFSDRILHTNHWQIDSQTFGRTP